MAVVFCKETRGHDRRGVRSVKIEDRIYNTMYAFDRTGRQIGAYSKLHLFRLMDEEKHLTAGSALVKLELEA
ncbi:hypothetical protein CM49_05899 [Paenibacillus sp. P1XP2]|nr:hypothetical protein CM49_05899 [Paenibacillus sp. P1XP2]